MRVKLTFTSKVVSGDVQVLCGTCKSTTYRERDEVYFVVTRFVNMKPVVQFQTDLFDERTMEAISNGVKSYIEMDLWINSVFFTIEDGRVIEEDMR